jgi:hypothetical protein
MADSNVTTTTAAALIDEAWTPELNRAIELDLVIAALFEDRSAQLKHGDVLHLPDSHHLTADTKSAGTALTPQAVTEDDQDFTVSTHQAVPQRIEDIASIQSKYALRAEFTYHGGYALARAMDVAAAALLDDNTTQTVGTLGAELSYSNLIDARTLLRNSPVKGQQVIVVAPATYGGFLKTDQFINAMYNGDTKGMAVRNAQVGKLFGATVYESQLTPGTAPNSSGCWWARGHFFKIIQRKPATHTWYSPLDVAWVVSMDQIYGVFEKYEADEAAEVTTRAQLGCVRLQSAK